MARERESSRSACRPSSARWPEPERPPSRRNASGIEGKGPPLVHKYYHPGHHGDAAFFQAARNGVRSHHWRFGDMPPVKGLTDADIKAIVRYVRELQKENGIFCRHAAKAATVGRPPCVSCHP